MIRALLIRLLSAFARRLERPDVFAVLAQKNAV